MPSKIIVSFSPPLIPNYHLNWSAHFDGEEEAGPYGYGETQEQAIADLMARMEERA